MYVFRSLGFLRDFLLRDCDTTYFGPAILHYVNRGIGNDCKTRKKPSDLITMLSRVKLHGQVIELIEYAIAFSILGFTFAFIHIH